MVTSHQFVTDRHKRAEQAGLEVEPVIASLVLRPEVDQEIPSGCGDGGDAPTVAGTDATNFEVLLGDSRVKPRAWNAQYEPCVPQFA